MGVEDTKDIQLNASLDDALFDSYYLTPQTAQAIGVLERELRVDSVARELDLSGVHTMMLFLKNIAEQDGVRYLGSSDVSVAARTELCKNEVEGFALSLLKLSKTQFAPVGYLFLQRVLPQAETCGRTPHDCKGFVLSELISKMTRVLSNAAPEKNYTCSTAAEFYHSLDMQFPFLPDIAHLDDTFLSVGDEIRLDGLLNLPMRIPRIINLMEKGSLVEEYRMEERKNREKNMNRSFAKSKYLKIRE